MKDYAVAPGEFLQEWLEDEDVTQEELAHRTGTSRKRINEIVNGKARITEDFAHVLGLATGIPAATWLRHENRYRRELAELAQLQNLRDAGTKISSNLGTYLREQGVTTATRRYPEQMMADFLEFLGFGSPQVLEKSLENDFSGAFALAALRESGSGYDLFALKAWLRVGEKLETSKQRVLQDFDEAKLQAILPALRTRCAAPDSELIDDVANLLASVGVEFRVVVPPKKFPLYGVTQWVGNRPIIQLTNRRKKDGHLIWTIFHEIGHILNDPREGYRFELKPNGEAKHNQGNEKAANKFAEDVLFAGQGLKPFRGLRREDEIISAARALGIAPGVAVFLMQRRRLIPYSACNSLCINL